MSFSYLETPVDVFSREDIGETYRFRWSNSSVVWYAWVWVSEDLGLDHLAVDHLGVG